MAPGGRPAPPAGESLKKTKKKIMRLSPQTPLAAAPQEGGRHANHSVLGSKLLKCIGFQWFSRKTNKKTYVFLVFWIRNQANTMSFDIQWHEITVLSAFLDSKASKTYRF